MSSERGLSYRDAGVDRDVAERAKTAIRGLVGSTKVPGVLSEVGSFGGLFRMPPGFEQAVLVASADGVGTKLKVAMRAGVHDTVGHDLVNHCVNDILVEGAEPLFFLDYVGMGRLEAGVVEALVAGVAAGCRENGCALLGGETAEMPDFYEPGEYDLAGFIVGAVDEKHRTGAQRVRAGDTLVGLEANGFHTNGYSLVRHVVFDRMGLDVADAFPGVDATVADVLLRVHRSYLGPVRPLLRAGLVSALAHITGGGIPGNLDRSIPAGLQARVDTSAWAVPAEFGAIEEAGVDEDEMYRTFNMGIGMILIVAEASAEAVLRGLRGAGQAAHVIGRVRASDGAEQVVLA
ncbi:MAG TPA: phosphoribosylformylglycinamidine cyclo-ligase [Longimicrobiales bacterium]|nr:phosphoribosylformylglycinamidine cyclo-ligase [Longimicrobiales bacterium]